MATLNLGRIKPVFRGAYSGSTAYVVDDIVTSGGSSYICIQAHGAGTQAVNQTAYWTQMAAGGTDVGTTLTTQGDILYRDGSGLQRLAKGTAGQALKMNTAANAPEWGTISSDFVKLNESTASNVASHSIDGFFSSDYDNYLLIGNGLQPASDGDLRFRFQQSGSANTSSEYVYATGMSYTDITPTHLWQKQDAAYSDWNNPDPQVNLSSDDQNSAATHAGQIRINIYNPLSTTNWKIFDVDWKYSYANNWNRLFNAGFLKNTSALSGIQFFYSSGNITSGSFKLYGMK